MQYSISADHALHSTPQPSLGRNSDSRKPRMTDDLSRDLGYLDSQPNSDGMPCLARPDPKCPGGLIYPAEQESVIREVSCLIAAATKSKARLGMGVFPRTMVLSQFRWSLSFRQRTCKTES
jgi:hypothetical protein